MVAVHQFIPSFVPRDAVSNHARFARKVLADLGIDSELYVSEARGTTRREVHYFRDFMGRSGPDTWLLYHLSTGSPMAAFLKARREPRIVDYHNITPPEFFETWEPGLAPEMAEGLRQMRALAPDTAAAMADSSFNAEDLRAAGYPRPAVVPILVDVGDLEGEVDEPAEERLRAAKESGGADWVFVGRIAPNKAQHDIVKAFAIYRRLYDDQARLHLLGTSSSHAYWTGLRNYVEALGLAGAVALPGSVSEGVKAAHLRTADVYVCLSEHEGFCVPLLEAWHHDLPVVAFAAAAVPETVGTGGLLLDDKRPSIVAAAAHRVATDEVLRAGLVAAGRERLDDFRLDRTMKVFADAVTAIVGAG